MKKLHFVATATTFLVGVTVVVGMMGHSALAATGQIYLSPASPSVLNGSNVTLDLRINPGTAVDGVQATVNFDSTKLQYVSATTSSSAFAAQLQQTQSGTTITIARGDFSGGISADSLVESITFKALTGSGSSSVTLTNANATDHNTSTYTNPSVANATVNFTSPPATCPTGQTGTPPNCTTPSSGSGGSSTSGSSSSSGNSTPAKPTGNSTSASGTTTTPTTTAPAGDNTPTVSAQNLQFTKAVFTTQTQVPTQVYVQFGTNKDALDKQTPLSGLATSHDVTVDDQALIPGQTYYYVVVSKDQQGHIAQSTVQSFTTKGLTLTVGVYDKDRQPIRNKTVTLHSTPMTGKTDDRGFVTFTNVTPGDHQVIYADGKQSYDQKISVVNNVKTEGGVQTAPVQNASVVYNNVSQNTGMASRMVVLAILTAVVAGGIIFVVRRKSQSVVAAGTPLTMQPVVVGHPDGAAPAMSTQVTAGDRTVHEEMAERLNNIPTPNGPAPGSTVAPLGSEEHREQ